MGVADVEFLGVFWCHLLLHEVLPMEVVCLEVLDLGEALLRFHQHRLRWCLGLLGWWRHFILHAEDIRVYCLWQGVEGSRVRHPELDGFSKGCLH